MARNTEMADRSVRNRCSTIHRISLFYQTKQRKEVPMGTDDKGTHVQENPSGVYGVEEMLNVAGSIPIHSSTDKIEDGGELCDSDCVDCD